MESDVEGGKEMEKDAMRGLKLSISLKGRIATHGRELPRIKPNVHNEQHKETHSLAKLP